MAPYVVSKSCTYSIVDDGNNGSGGGASSGGTGGGAGGSTQTQTPTPCPPSVPSNNSVSNRNLVIDQVDPTNPGGGDGGFPPPTTTQSPCTIVTVTTPQTITIDKLMNNPGSLTADQKAQLQTLLNQMLKNCIGQAMFNYFNLHGIKFNFGVVPGMPSQASYNPSTGTINIQNTSNLSVDNLQEEFFHAIQNFTYPGGTAQYTGTSGSANIEFEAKVLHDMISSIYGGAIIGGNTDPYNKWINSLTNNTTMPFSFTGNQRDYYFLYMNDFIHENSQYSSNIINYNLNPTAMFSLIQNSPCSN